MIAHPNLGKGLVFPVGRIGRAQALMDRAAVAVEPFHEMRLQQRMLAGIAAAETVLPIFQQQGRQTEPVTPPEKPAGFGIGRGDLAKQDCERPVRPGGEALGEGTRCRC